ncbi:MAG: hypothetical protein R8N23_06900 [Reichenbachiella sp.]|uniref:hypothetical protein n=1 Tax=Reichenbachiella sp. TaxID=2184521 RepID=UPI0029667834|nr:hypothetical protein [Reichenbachiella sp.]MDW3209574.1 hypothetical protein [Reichenbachiella sp.]
MNRKVFLTKVSAALLAGIPLLSLWNCSDNSEDEMDMGMDGDSSKSCIDNGTSISIDGNHGHSLTVSKADVDAGTAKTYDITGSSGHSHSVTVSSSNFASLKDNTSVNIDSTSGDGHTHSITVSCA